MGAPPGALGRTAPNADGGAASGIAERKLDSSAKPFSGKGTGLNPSAKDFRGQRRDHAGGEV
eukprot:gene30528-34120_t